MPGKPALAVISAMRELISSPCGGFRKPSRCRAFPEGISGTAGPVRSGITRREDPTDRVWGGSPLKTVSNVVKESRKRSLSWALHTYVASATKAAFIVWHITAKKRMVGKLRAIKTELRRRMHEPVASVGEWLRRV